MDTDVQALEEALNALMKSTSRRALIASLNFIEDTFINHPPYDLPDHLMPERKPEKRKDSDGRYACGWCSEPGKPAVYICRHQPAT